MKIYLILGALIAALFVYTLTQGDKIAKLKAQNELVLSVNKELNLSLSRVIEQNARDKEILKQKFEADLLNLQKKERALSYVKNSRERNVSKLFNDSILLLQ